MKSHQRQDGRIDCSIIRMLPILPVLCCSLFAYFPVTSYGKTIPDYHVTVNEKPGRGLIVIHKGKGEVAVSWRLFKKDPSTISFDLYRSASGEKAVKINDEPIAHTTYYTDHQVDTSKDQRYSLVIHSSGKKTGIPVATYLLSVEKAQKPYLSIPLVPLAVENAGLYQPNDASVGDLDGDGEPEIVLKRMGAFYACSQAGMSPGGIILEAYKLNGTRLWQMDLGPNIRQGAQYFQFLVSDFDGDGRAEVAMKTSEGTRFGDNRMIGDTNGDGVTDYINRDSTSRLYGKIVTGPEFFSVVDGLTGKELARGPYIERGNIEDWGDNYANRMDRQLGAVGYFDGKTPCIFWGRGYNGKSVMHTWTFRNGQLKRLWLFDTSTDKRYKEYENQGNHNIRIGDVDGDGKDEVIYGACAIDHDGKPLHTTKLGHGDAMHLTDIDPSHPGLEVWQCHEYAPNPAGSSLRDAVTGKLLVKIPSTSDVGRCLCADIDPRYPGCEIWSSQSGGVLSCKGALISKKLPSINMAIWWDGDLSRELLDGTRIEKWTGDGTITLFDGKKEGILSNNGTKANPCLAADIFGDWREEVIWRSAANDELRIYLTPYETAYRFPSFLEDIIYRLSVVNQNVGYNQPAEPGRYFGTDNDETMKHAFDQLNKSNWKEKLNDTGTGNWTDQWFLDGQRATITNTKKGMRFEAGPNPSCDADHAVLWTKKEFKGTIKVDYDFVRLDSVNRFVNIIYLEAEGSGKAPYSTNIAEWSRLREVPAMSIYYNHMNALHLSYAAFENDSGVSNPDYIRARRYLPETGNGLTGTALSPEYLCPLLFQPNVMHHITIIKNDKQIMMRVTTQQGDRYFRFSTSGFPEVRSGKIGLRQMGSRKSLYSQFRVFEQ